MPARCGRSRSRCSRQARYGRPISLIGLGRMSGDFTACGGSPPACSQAGMQPPRSTGPWRFIAISPGSRMIRNRQPHDINPLGRLTQWLCSCKCPRLVPIAILFVYKGVEFLKTFSLYSRALQAKLQHPRPRLLFADVAVAATPDAVADCVMSETLLYPAVKRFLEARGFDVKGEVKGCDIVSVRREETLTLTIVEMKLGFTLELLLQVTDRMRAADEVWLAVPATRRGRDRDPRVHRLCRLLGFGLMAVRAARDRVDVLVEPGPYQPRRDHRRRSQLLSEHTRRRGDPAGGGITRQPGMRASRPQ